MRRAMCAVTRRIAAVRCGVISDDARARRGGAIAARRGASSRGHTACTGAIGVPGHNRSSESG